MAKRYVVKAGGVVARVAGVDRYIERGTELPDEVENIEHLVAVGLVEAVDEPKKPAAKQAEGK